MTDLRKTPSVQHAVALIANTVVDTVRNLERLDAAQISICLDPGRRLFKPLMEGRSVEWAIGQCRLEKPHNIKPNIDLVQAFAPFAADRSVRWFRECEKHYYPIGSGIVIPVKPSGFWAADGKLNVLWVQSWKGRTLDPLQKAIFNTILQDTFFVGDFKDAQLEWLDLRETKKGCGRGIQSLTSEDLATVSRTELSDYLRILLEASELYAKAKAERSAAKKSEASKHPGPPLPLFPDDPH